MLMILLSLRCVSFNAGVASNPTLPASNWHLFSDASVGYALAIPESWNAFDLDRGVDAVIEHCGSNLRERVADLHDRGVRLFACDSAQRGSEPVLAYAIRGQLPSEGLDNFLDGVKQPPGREVVERRHIEGTVGAITLQRVREQLGSSDTMQYQFYVVRFSTLHVLFVEVPTSLYDGMRETLERIGTTFTPLR